MGVRLLVEAEGNVELALRADIGGVGLAGSVTWTTGTLRTLPASGSGGTCSRGVVGLGTAGEEERNSSDLVVVETFWGRIVRSS